MTDASAKQSMTWRPWRWPLTLRVLLGVVLGVLVGLGIQLALGPHAPRWLADLRESSSAFKSAIESVGPTLGTLGNLVVRLLTALASPLIFFAILDAFLRTEISGRQGVKLIFICLLNVSVAFAIGLVILNLVHPGMRTRLEQEQAAAAMETAEPDSGSPERPKTELPTAPSPIHLISEYVPTSVVQPFQENRVMSIVILALLGGIALRRVRQHQSQAGEQSFETLDKFVEAAYQWTMRILEILIEAIPFAVFGLMAKVVAESGLEYFGQLKWYLPCTLLGLGLHALGYYPLSSWLVGKVPPNLYLGKGMIAVVTGFSANSSLAVVPVTLRCLNDGMGVSPESARLSACVGTNFNNDGITLYEAMSALFAVELMGHDLGMAQQLTVIAVSLMTSLGMAGLPGSGFIILPLVLKAAGLTDQQVLEVLPLFISMDWLLARIRTAVNVLGDMQVAVLLDAGRR
ncbi:MAG: dicarboxylate/amino acid:cation symporter [Pirellulales bacterium]